MANYINETYRKFFDIDPEYFPQVNEAIIKQKPDLWKSFYPHATFIKLINNTIDVLDRKYKQSIWVDGAYGTGKSHAVLTLKKMLDASKEDIDEYFAKYSNSLSEDLHHNFLRVKNGKIVTVHRYGSSNIRNDRQLVFAIQESILQGLKEHGIDNKAAGSLKDAALSWLEAPEEKSYFNALVTGKFVNEFGGDDADTIIQKLKTGSNEAVAVLMSKITDMAEKCGITALNMDTNGLAAWITAIIRENDLKAIVFIWDEFTNYFENNMRALTGFQKIVDISGSDPFYMIIVTHNVNTLFQDTKSDSKRILDRFVSPICNITLPENMAFELMAEALKITDDVALKNEWETDKEEFVGETTKSRAIVAKNAKVNEDILKKIIPIHPYAALLLKHIATAFNSNQRSMFDFIKNDHGDEIKGFQWFIDNYGPLSDQPLLTIDMLWDFFYEKGKEHLTMKVRNILDCYDRMQNYNLNTEEKRVFKTILMLQAISDSLGGNFDLFIPNNQNLDYAFEGTRIFMGFAGSLAQNLINKKVIYEKPIGGGRIQYAVLVNNLDDSQLDAKVNELKQRPFKTIVDEAKMEETFKLNNALKLRYKSFDATTTSWDKSKWYPIADGNSNNLVVVYCFAKDDTDARKLISNIQDGVGATKNVIFVDTSVNPLGQQKYDKYINYLARSVMEKSNDRKLSDQYAAYATDVLKEWKNSIQEFTVYSKEFIAGEHVSNKDALEAILKRIVEERFEACLESSVKASNINSTMWTSTTFGQGAQCGIKEELAGPYKGSKLEDYLADGWKVKDYWQANPYALISKIKIAVEKVIEEGFKKNDRVSLDDIYDVLRNKPFGIIPCNLTAFVLGFVLKEYADEKYLCSDGTNSEPMSIEKLKNIIDGKLKNAVTPSTKYKSQYIVTLTETQRAFNLLTAKVFNISPSLCTSIEKTKDQIRNKMKALPFPIWCLRYVIDNGSYTTDKDILNTVLENYAGIANTANLGSKSEADLAMEIGKLCLDNGYLAQDLVNIVTPDNCNKGMKCYLQEFNGGELLNLANSVYDTGNYLDCLRKRFDADAANWVWNRATAEAKIKEVIRDYKIIKATNDTLGVHENTLNAAVKDWCDKCNNLHISYLYARNEFTHIDPIMSMLYKTCKINTVLDIDKDKFLEAIELYGKDFVDYYNNGQLDFFTTACNVSLSGVDGDTAKKIYFNLGSCFLKDKQDYLDSVNNAVQEYKKNSLITCAKELWRTKTNTDSPLMWSEKYCMPVCSFVDSRDLSTARNVFALLNRGNGDETSVKEAIEYLQKISYYDKMNDEKARDNAFRATIIGDYECILTDIDKVKKLLRSSVSDSPYNWRFNTEVPKTIKKLANDTYLQGGNSQAMQKIDRMSEKALREYLKTLIADNVDVGLAIIKSEE